MDRSFLSQSSVIAASRDFVCVRLTTYENKEEGAFLKAFNVTRSGELENTVFTILAPDGKTQLARASRSADHSFTYAERMAQGMKRIAGDYVGKIKAGSPQELPKVDNVRLAINVAACDNQPLVLILEPDAEKRKELEARVNEIAWSEPFLGRFIYASTASAGDLRAIEGVKTSAGVLVVQSDKFGLKGKVLTQVATAGVRQDLVICLREGLKAYPREQKSFGQHVFEGHQKGIFWQTVIPVTDPMEQRARERGRNPGPPE